MWNDEIGVNKLIQPNITEITFKVNPDSEYSFNFQTIYENGLRSLIQVIEFKSAPEILEPTVFKRTDVSGNFNPHAPDRFTPSRARCAENCGSALTHR